MFRTEKDSLGEKQVPADALYGIHSVRARENFPGNDRFQPDWYKAVGTVKIACYQTYGKFIEAASGKSPAGVELPVIGSKILNALIGAATEVSEGGHFDSFIVPAVQGGAGTSINMNINEIITNVALIRAGNKPGDYRVIDPVEHANIYQSTNDVIPTALTIAVMRLLIRVEESINKLRKTTEGLERNNRNKLRPGFTQMQEAVPSSFGLLFGAYNEALSRDWWRVSKCFERIKVVNLGGGAIGTGLAIPRFFIMEVVPELRRLTGLPVTHSENLADATSNLDKWVEVHSILKAHAVNLEKIAGDIRLLSSDISGNKLISIPDKQAGSSIMPGKINPVIPEYVISASHKIYSNDQLITSLASQGCLDLNAYLPSIGYAVIDSLLLLINAGESLCNNLLSELIIHETTGYQALIFSPSITTALVPHIGFNKASDLAALMKEKKIDIYSANDELSLIGKSKLQSLLKPENLLKSGFSLDDLIP